MTMRRAVLGFALILGLLGMHGLATGHMTMPAPMPSAALPAATMSSGAMSSSGGMDAAARGTASGTDMTMHHEMCVGIQRDDLPSHVPGHVAVAGTSACDTWPVPIVAGRPGSGRSPPDVDLERLGVSRT